MWTIAMAIDVPEHHNPRNQLNNVNVWASNLIFIIKGFRVHFNGDFGVSRISVIAFNRFD